jgi:hypothetical protein
VTVAASTPAFRQPFVGEPDLLQHTGFILAEDDALHRYLENIVVPKKPDEDAGQKVRVWFRFPEGERQISYPFITINMIDVAPAYELWTSEFVVDTEGLYRPSVMPSLPAPNTDMGYSIRPYLAFHITYQVTVHTRSNLHDRYLASLFFTDIFPPRPFWLGVDADNTWRRCELLDFAQQDVPESTESGIKRIFRKMYTISMLSEIPQERLYQSWKVLRVFVAITDRQMVDDYMENVLKPNISPDLTVPEDVRRNHGELSYYVNDFANVGAETAMAVGSAGDSGVVIP